MLCKEHWLSEEVEMAGFELEVFIHYCKCQSRLGENASV